MTYQVLARKWRPQTFNQMVGQQHVLRALINALDQNRLHHAYLFTGTRGVGKTTIARILAKCLNCEKGVSSQPCENCSTCREITEGRFVDLIEVDAASRTKVEDTRDLLENVQYAPNRGRYKVYLIDEVHMLSGHSFNALLKTLEEPPPHVKFLLATTDPQRLPITILSRCLQFHLKNMPPELIVGHLETLLKEENIAYELPALWQIGRAADGSMRDALSLLDQAIAYGNGKVSDNDVHTLLGTLPIQQITPLLTALVNNNAHQLIQQSQQLSELGADFQQILEEMLHLLQQIALAQVVPESIDKNHAAYNDIINFAKQMKAEDIQLYYQIGLIGRRDLLLAPNPKMGFEMILIRMLLFRPDNMQIATEKSGQQSTQNNSASRGTQNTASIPTNNPATNNVNHSKSHNQSASNTLINNATTNISTPPIIPASNLANSNNASITQNSAAIQSDNPWFAIVKNLPLSGITQALANNCALQNMDEQSIDLLLDPSHAALLNSRHEERLKQALETYFNKTIKLKISTGSPTSDTPAQTQQRAQQAEYNAAKKSLDEDPGVQQLLKTFNATIQPESITTVESD